MQLIVRPSWLSNTQYFQQKYKPPSTQRYIHWEPTPKFFKLNCDGSTKGNPGIAGGGGVIRDEFGNWIKGFARKIGATTPIASECWALRDGLELANSIKCLPLIVEIDASHVISLIKDCPNNHYCKSILDDCRLLLRELQVHEVTHIYRESNKLADALANMAVSFSSTRFSILNCPPAGVELILRNDCNKLGTLRHFYAI